MKKKSLMKKPIRTCVYTRIKNEKGKLLRLVKSDDGMYILDLEQKVQKRAIYISTNEKVLKIIDKNKKYPISEKEIELVKKEIMKRIKVGENNGE